MSVIYYPPLVEGKLPAFSVDDENAEVKINVPYVLNKAVSLNDFSHMAIMLKTATTGTVKLNSDTGNCKMQNLHTKQKYATFTFYKDDAGSDASLQTFTPTVGNYYKIQIAFKKIETQEDGDPIEYLSPWSSVGVIKCTSAPALSISNLSTENDNINPNLYIGTYQNKDVTEKLYSYNFTIYDENNQIYDTSGVTVHNSSTDENIAGIGVRSTLQWVPKKSLPEGKRYRIALEIETINGYIKTTPVYYVKSGNTVDAKIPARLLATPDYDNGRVKLSLIKTVDAAEEIPFTGNFVISRYSVSENTWRPVCRFNMLSQVPSEVGILWIDYTLEHGAKYLYALQAYNDNDLYSNRMYHVLANPDIYSQKKYLDYDELGNPYYITSDFEDMFLTDGERQLKIRFDPKVSTYKPTILENKVETIGSKYPFIFRNGSVNYKEFAISGLLSYLIDEDELFMQGIQPQENTITRSTSPAAAGKESREHWLNTADAGTKLTSDNFYRERQFKTFALDWLTNGKPKLFRSPSEGNYIVQLMNASLSPNDTLGRMLHTFSATAYEIAECNFDTLNEYDLLYLPNIDNRTMKFTQVNLYSASTGDVYAPGCGMYQVNITNATPGTKYELAFNDLLENSTVSYTIGITGSLYLDMDMYPVSSIRLIEGDFNHTAVLFYGYYDTAIPDNFSYIADINTREEMAQIVGYDDTKNIIEDSLEDIRRDIGHFYSITIRPRDIETIYSHNSKFYRDSSYYTEITDGWSDLTIYYVVEKNTYYSGHPNKNISLGSKYPQKYFKLNNAYILDLSTGNAYLSSDPLLNVLRPNPQAAEKFVAITNGSYQVIGDFGEIRAIHLSPGVYVDLAYELKEILYTVEETEDDVKEAKQNWETASEAEKDIAYEAYINILTEAIARVEQEEGYYVL